MAIVIGAETSEQLLITVADYRDLTGDLTTDDGAAEVAIVRAQKLLSEYLRRGITLEERTEPVQLVGAIGYPRAVPVTNAGTYTIIDDYRIEIGELVYEWGQQVNHVRVTYTGGYDLDTAPETIKGAIAEMTRTIVSTTAMAIPGGASSVRLGDAAVTFSKGYSGGPLTDDIKSRVAKYRWRNV